MGGAHSFVLFDPHVRTCSCCCSCCSYVHYVFQLSLFLSLSLCFTLSFSFSLSSLSPSLTHRSWQDADAPVVFEPLRGGRRGRRGALPGGAGAERRPGGVRLGPRRPRRRRVRPGPRLQRYPCPGRHQGEPRPPEDPRGRGRRRHPRPAGGARPRHRPPLRRQQVPKKRE